MLYNVAYDLFVSLINVLSLCTRWRLSRHTHTRASNVHYWCVCVYIYICVCVVYARIVCMRIHMCGCVCVCTTQCDKRALVLGKFTRTALPARDKAKATTTIEVAHKWTPVNPRKECPITQLQLIFNLFFLCLISHSNAGVGLVFVCYIDGVGSQATKNLASDHLFFCFSVYFRKGLSLAPWWLHLITRSSSVSLAYALLRTYSQFSFAAIIYPNILSRLWRRMSYKVESSSLQRIRSWSLLFPCVFCGI